MTTQQTKDRPTRPEQITIVTAPPQLIQAGERLMEDLRQQQQQEAMACLAAVRATKQRRTWPGVLVALLVIGALAVTYWGAG